MTHVYGGTRLTLELCDPLGEDWYDRECPPLPEIERLCADGLRPRAVVFDLGAHQGVVALMLAHAGG